MMQSSAALDTICVGSVSSFLLARYWQATSTERSTRKEADLYFRPKLEDPQQPSKTTSGSFKRNFIFRSKLENTEHCMVNVIREWILFPRHQPSIWLAKRYEQLHVFVQFHQVLRIHGPKLALVFSAFDRSSTRVLFSP